MKLSFGQETAVHSAKHMLEERKHGLSRSSETMQENIYVDAEGESGNSSSGLMKYLSVPGAVSAIQICYLEAGITVEISTLRHRTEVFIVCRPCLRDNRLFHPRSSAE